MIGDQSKNWKLWPLLQYSAQFNSVSMSLTASCKQFSVGSLFDMEANDLSPFNYAAIKIGYTLDDTWTFWLCYQWCFC